MSVRNTDLLKEYKNWIFSHEFSDVTIIETDNNIKMFTEYARGEINFYPLEMVIIEMKITNFKDKEDIFFLHFELNDIEHAKQLFNEMTESLIDLKNKQKIQVLLCCTSGITTNYFAGKLNETAVFLGLDYEFKATSLSNVYEIGFDYPIIMIAPQIGYQFKKMKEIFYNKTVINIPAKVFANYDTMSLIEIIRHEERNNIVDSLKINKVEKIKNNLKILTIALMPTSEKVKIAYRIYENGEMLYEGKVVKFKFDLINDLKDILDTVTIRCEKYDAVGISVSGIVNDGFLDLPGYINPDINLKKILENKYKVPIIISNNVNAAVLGYYSQQTKYQNIVFMSQPRGWKWGGQGILVNGKLIEGKHNVAGEVKYLLLDEDSIEGVQRKCVDPEEILETVTISIRAGISIVDPEVVLVRSELTPDVNEIKDNVAKIIPMEYLPDFIYVRDSEMMEFILLGQMMICLDKIQSK